MIKDSNLPNKQEHPKSCPRTTKDWTKAGHYLVEEGQCGIEIVTYLTKRNIPRAAQGLPRIGLRQDIIL